MRYDDCEALYPLDTRQSEQLLAQVANYDELQLEGPPLHLIETENSGDTFVMLAHHESKILTSALLREDGACSCSIGEYGGVRWRVLGHTNDGLPPIELTHGNCQESIRQIAASLQALLPAAVPSLEHERYTAATADGIEYGFTFRMVQGEDTIFDLVLGVVGEHAQGQIKVDQARYEWAAKTIPAFAPPTP
ncbi:hypothetical protein ACQCLI_32530 (plasmid) [Pseudomonas nitroreducens]|uniref:hypothetical protein n=1 Tax=Pseudomonas nitroreducens TaxID=46680 RepID=UPI0003648D1C|nr:hypothetical protein [Pseudomonas nitroreducens]